MLRYPHTQKKYLVIAGAIANFTHIDRTFAGIIDALRERIDDIYTQHVHILVRRGGIHDKK
jgi:succinyl-CoA synthetase beta subunit